MICDGKSGSRIKDLGSKIWDRETRDFEYGALVTFSFFEYRKGTFAMPKRDNSDVVSGRP